MLLDRLFNPPVHTSECEIGLTASDLFPEEAQYISGAIYRRRGEFAAGRRCARQAMGQMGLPEVAIPAGPDRAPQWPDGVVGSISHSETRCGAALAFRADGFRAIGLDIERATPLSEVFADDICIESERSWLALQPSSSRGLLLKAFFSAKECTYKCQYPLTRSVFGFEALRIELQIAAGNFVAEFRIDALPFRAGDRLAGRIQIAQGHIVAAMTLA